MAEAGRSEKNPNRNRDRYPNRKLMALGHEKLDVYRLAIGYVAWGFEHSEKLNGLHRHARDQWLRASQSIPLNIAEGNGKTAEADRRRYFEIARGSFLECAAIQDVLVVGQGLVDRESRERKMELDRMAAKLSRLGKRGYSVQEESADYRIDFDSDFDFDGINFQQAGAGQPATRPVAEPEGGDKPQPEAEGRSRQPVAALDRCAPSKARRFLSGERPDVSKPSQQKLPSVADMTANPMDITPGHGYRFTRAMRSIVDCAKSGDSDPEMLFQSLRDGLARGLITRREVKLARELKSLPDWMNELLGYH